MFGRKPKPEAQLAEKQAIRLLDDMDMFGPTSEEYATCMKHYVTLTDTRNSKRNRVSSDAVVTAGANFLVALLIVAYEQKHVLTTKAPSFMLKNK